jgi:hypothetical protein
MLEKRFVNLAELLTQIMVESPEVSSNAEIPRSTVLRTARALEEGYKNGDFREDEEGRLYNVLMVDNYGGFIDRSLRRQGCLVS